VSPHVDQPPHCVPAVTPGPASTIAGSPCVSLRSGSRRGPCGVPTDLAVRGAASLAAAGTLYFSKTEAKEHRMQAAKSPSWQRWPLLRCGHDCRRLLAYPLRDRRSPAVMC
jgi:hypothetical protein